MNTNNRNNRGNRGTVKLFQALDPNTRQGLNQVKANARENARQEARDAAIATRRAKRQQEREAARAALTPVSQDLVGDIGMAKRNIVTLAKAYGLPVPAMKRVNAEAVIAEAEKGNTSVTDVIRQQADAACAAIRQQAITRQDNIAAQKGSDFNLVAVAMLSYLAQRVVRASAALDVASAAASVGKYYKCKPNAEEATKATSEAETAIDAVYAIVGTEPKVSVNGLLRSYVKDELARVLKLKLDPKRDPLVYAAQVLAAKARKRNGGEQPQAETKAAPVAETPKAPLMDVPAEWATDERSIDAARLCYLEKGVWPTSKAQLAAYKGKLTKMEKAAAAA